MSKISATFLAIFLTTLGFIVFLSSYHVEASPEYPYIYSAKLSRYAVIVNQSVTLNVEVRNPMNVTANVIVKVSDSNINFFPSNTSTKPIPPKPLYSSYSSTEFSFILKPTSVNEHFLEVELWWNETQVDSELLILKAYNMVDPNLWSFYFRFLLAYLVSFYTFVVVQLYRFDIKFHYTTKSGSSAEFGKGTILGIFTFIYWIFSIAEMSSIETYYSLIPFILPAIGRIEGVLAIGIILSAFCWLTLLSKRHDISLRVSYLILTFFFFSLVWDWVLFPMPYLGLMEPIIKLSASIVIEELLRILIERRRVKKSSLGN
jgi:hypothetical protein